MLNKYEFKGNAWIHEHTNRWITDGWNQIVEGLECQASGNWATAAVKGMHIGVGEMLWFNSHVKSKIREKETCIEEKNQGEKKKQQQKSVTLIL